MISILIVDDDNNKVRRVKEVIGEVLTSEEASVQVAGSVAMACQIMRNDSVSLLVVDLNVPPRSDSAPVGDGGARLLRRVSRPHAFKTPEHILGLTEYDNLRETFEKEFADESWHIVTFSWTSDEWEEPLRRKLLYIAAGRESGHKFEADLAIVTALERVELEAVLALAPRWRVEQASGDPTAYHRATFRRGGRVLQVVAAAAPEMGMAAAAALTTKVICRFKPRYLAMAGIAAGVSGQFGDVIVADRAWDYGSGKVKPNGRGRRRWFHPAPSQVPIDQVVKAKLSLFLQKAEILKKIRSGWNGRKVPEILGIQMGPFASGAAVVSARSVIDGLVRQQRKLAAVEMETYGVLLAAQMAAAPKPAAFAIKSICDFGDRRKSDVYQRYAAYTSARFLQEFAFEQLSA